MEDRQQRGESNGDLGEKGGLGSKTATLQQMEMEVQPSSPSAKKPVNARHAHRQKTTSSARTHSSSRDDEALDRATPLEESYDGATIFHRGDRPQVMPSQSYTVAGGTISPRSGSFDNRLSWKNIGGSLPRLPSMPSMPELPSISFVKTRDSSKRSGTMTGQEANTLQQHIEEDERAVTETGPSTTTTSSTSKDIKAAPSKAKLADLHAKHPNLKDMSKPLLPIATFPNQGTGKASEFNQATPIWARQPFKLLYFAYFGLSVGLIFLPWFALSSLFKSQRARSSWSWKRSTLVKLYRHGTRLTFRTYTSLSRDITKEVPHSKTVRAKFVWVGGLPDELIRGEVRSTMKLQNIKPTRTCGFWYGERDGGGGVGQRSTAGEKVVYHLHGGAYWIGTAHEKDVTSAVNMQVLRALDTIYDSRMPETDCTFNAHHDLNGNSGNGKYSPHPPNGGPAHRGETVNGHKSGGHCKRSFSLDYRLCVPRRPEMGSYPAALLDSLAGYRYLVNECGFEPKNIIVAGDSAGGNLALAMCRYLRDERIEQMPGAMLLLSPWADASRSHSGPYESPNKFSTTYTNSDCDIISPSIAFRNTAVSALLGKLAARETYRNPYISSISLQLPIDKGGSGPNWGFEGFPKNIYICTGSAELSYDQHLTLAYRLAAGTVNGRPIHSGDKLSIDEDPYEIAARLRYPRPKDYEITLWPSAQGTPAGTPLAAPSGWGGGSMQRTNSRGSKTSVNGKEPTSYFEAGRENLDARLRNANGRVSKSSSSSQSSLRQQGKGAKEENEQQSNIDVQGDERLRQDQSLSPSTGAAAANDTQYEAGTGPNMSQVKEKDTQSGVEVTHEHDHRQEKPDEEAKEENGAALSTARRAKRSNSGSLSTMMMDDIVEDQASNEMSNHRLEASYFDLGREDRKVILDECKDAIHDYTLFDWYEPERGRTWARIAQWIDKEV